MSICKAQVENYFFKAFVKSNTAVKGPSLLPNTMKNSTFSRIKNQEE